MVEQYFYLWMVKILEILSLFQSLLLTHFALEVGVFFFFFFPVNF